MSAAVERVVSEQGAVGVLVNNAGYSQSGAIETVAMGDVRRQFETNVFGLIRMSQLVLPGMRAQRSGRSVNVSSMGANFTFPGAGIYHATKYAVEAVSDAATPTMSPGSSRRRSRAARRPSAFASRPRAHARRPAADDDRGALGPLPGHPVPAPRQGLSAAPGALT
jgi:hypothetical protein